MKTVVIKDNEWQGEINDHFPVKATWDGGRYSEVFVSVDAVKHYIFGRYGKVRYIDKRSKKEEVQHGV